MTAQVVKSYGPFGSGTALFFLRPAYDSPTGHFHVRYGHIGDHVAANVNAIGQIVDDNRREIDSHITRYGGSAAVPLRSSSMTRTTTSTGADRCSEELESRRVVAVEFRNRLSTDLSWTEEFKRFEKNFRNREVGFDLGYNTRAYQSSERASSSAATSMQTSYCGRLRRATRSRGSSQPNTRWQRLELKPDPRLQSTWIHVVEPISSSRRTYSCGSSSRPTPRSIGTTSRRCLCIGICLRWTIQVLIKEVLRRSSAIDSRQHALSQGHDGFLEI